MCITNNDRAGWAGNALESFQVETGTDDCDAVADLLCDLMHLCNLGGDVYGTFADALRRAESNYEAEIEEAI